MTSYKEFVHFLSSNGLNKIFLNSDLDKMKAVFTEMFSSSKKELRIFAGTLCNNVSNSEEYVETLSDFIENGGHLKILLNSFNEEEAKKSRLFNRLTYYESLDKYNIEIKGTDEQPVMNENGVDTKVHFAIGDKRSYRIETDIDERKAICNMNDPENAKVYADFFDELFDSERSVRIDLKKLFLTTLKKC